MTRSPLTYSQAEQIGSALRTRWPAITGKPAPDIDENAWADVIQFVSRKVAAVMEERACSVTDDGELSSLTRVRLRACVDDEAVWPKFSHGALEEMEGQSLLRITEEDCNGRAIRGVLTALGCRLYRSVIAENLPPTCAGRG